MVMFEAERLASTVAPRRAAYVEGGIGAQTSSQISTCRVRSGFSAQRNRRSAPRGAVCSQHSTSRASASRDEANWRFS